MGLQPGTVETEAPAPNREPLSVPDPAEAPVEPIETPAPREPVPA